MTDLSSALAGALEFVHMVNPSARGEEADGWGPAVGDRDAGEAPAPLDTASKARSGWGKGHQRGPGAASPAARIHSRGRRWRKAEDSAVSRWTARGTPRENAPYQFPVAPVRNDHGLCGLKQREFILSLVARRPKSRWGQGRGGGGGASGRVCPWPLPGWAARVPCVAADAPRQSLVTAPSPLPSGCLSNFPLPFPYEDTCDGIWGPLGHPG